LKPEESAAVRLVNGFLSVRANAELRPALQEAEKIRRRIGDRLTEAVRAGQLEVQGRNRLDLTVVVTIPARLIAADHIWSLLRLDEMEIAGQHYVDARIGPPEPLEQSDDAAALNAADRLELEARREREHADHEKENAYRRDLRRKKAASAGRPPDVHRTSGGQSADASSSAKEESLSVTADKPTPKAASIKAKPKTPRPPLPRGPREEWDWQELAEYLKQEQCVYNSFAEFVVVCQTEVQRRKHGPRGDSPDTTTVIEAIRRHDLQKYAKIRGVNYSDDDIDKSS